MGKHYESNLEVVTVKMAVEIMAALGKPMSERAIYQALRDGRLPGRKVHGTWLIRVADLERWEPVRHRPKKPRAG